MAGAQSNATTRPLSCQQCRQRKVACNKVLPCQSCQFSGLTCVFPSGMKRTTRTGNSELLRRIARLEQLIPRSESEGQETTILQSPTLQDRSSSAGDPSQQPQGSIRQDVVEDNSHIEKANASERFVGHSFIKSLATEIDLMKDLVEEDSIDEESAGPMASHNQVVPPSTGLGFYVGDAVDLQQLHPSNPHALQLSSYYASNVDPIFKILHIPSLRTLVTKTIANLDRISLGDPSIALLFAVYYAATTTLTGKECLTIFEDGKETLLARYKTGVERALSNADFLRRADFRSLQALTIFLVALRANDNTRLSWALFALAVRLSHALGLHRESSLKGLSVLDVELRRRLWWQLIILDGRLAPDVATDRLIIQTSFNTKKPSSIDDSDINETTKVINEREGLTEMTKCRLTHDIFEMAWRLQPDCLPGQGVGPPVPTTEEKMRLLTEVERHVTEKVLATCDPSNPIAWATWIVGHITIRRARLIVYYPLGNHQNNDPPRVSRDHLLLTAVECMEYCNLIDTDPIAARWKWFSSNAPVYWYGLAATLAGLCVQTNGPLVDRAWTIVDLVYEEWSARLAKSNDLKAWRPISKLRKKAQAQRNKVQPRNKDVAIDDKAQHPASRQVIASFGDFTDDNLSAGSQSTGLPLEVEQPTLGQTSDLQIHDPRTPAGNADVDLPLPSSDMDWAEWDQFTRDIGMEG